MLNLLENTDQCNSNYVLHSLLHINKLILRIKKELMRYVRWYIMIGQWLKLTFRKLYLSMKWEGRWEGLSIGSSSKCLLYHGYNLQTLLHRGEREREHKQ